MLDKALESLNFIEEKFAYLEYTCENFNSPKEELFTVKQALIKAQNLLIEKYYIVYIRQYTILLNDNVVYKKYIKTNDIYHYIGKYYSQALEKVERIDYQEISKERYEEGKDITYYKGKELD